MVASPLELARNSKFIPLAYNHCDMWCERCPITSRCLLFASEQQQTPLRAATDRMRARLKRSIELTSATIAVNPAGASITDLTRVEGSATPRPTAIGHPLEFLARHYAVQTYSFLNSVDYPDADRFQSDSSFETIAWYHTLIAAKTFRALTSEQGAATGAPELLSDALGSAKVVLVSIERSLAAWKTLAEGGQDARIAGLIELLEALRTGVELRFPDAHTFIRPGLDDGEGGG